MNWIFETIKCIFVSNRKDIDIIKPPKCKENIPLNDDNFKLIKECSWLGCGLEFYDKRPIFKKAKLCKKYYAFCCDECYMLWLKSNYIFY
jgi:hypothetical protein